MTPLKCSGYMCFPSGDRRAERFTYPDHTEGTDAHKRIFHLAEETHNDQKSGKAAAPVRSRSEFEASNKPGPIGLLCTRAVQMDGIQLPGDDSPYRACSVRC